MPELRKSLNQRVFIQSSTLATKAIKALAGGVTRGGRRRWESKPENYHQREVDSFYNVNNGLFYDFSCNTSERVGSHSGAPCMITVYQYLNNTDQEIGVVFIQLHDCVIQAIKVRQIQEKVSKADKSVKATPKMKYVLFFGSIFVSGATEFECIWCTFVLFSGSKV